MPKRFKLNKSNNRNIFRKGTNVHKKNTMTSVMRGGIRL